MKLQALVVLSCILLVGCAPAPRQFSGPVAFFATETGSERSENRSWPTISLHVKEEGKDAEVLAENIGKVGEFPAGFMMEASNRRILINLESKLTSLDVGTGALTDIFTPNKQILGMIYANDEKRMVVWDQIYANEDTAFFVHELNTETGDTKVLHEGDTEGKIFVPLRVRDDNTLLVLEALGEAAIPWTFDLNSGHMQPVPGHEEAGLFYGFSEHGNYLLAPNEIAEDVCNALLGMIPSSYSLVDPLSGEEVGTFGVDDRHNALVAFSPDDSELLFASFVPTQNPEDCGRQQEPEAYYRFALGGEPVVLKNYKTVLAEWESHQAAFDYTLVAGEDAVLNYEGQPFLVLEEGMKLIDAMVL